jgi:hypothetical protein
VKETQLTEHLHWSFYAQASNMFNRHRFYGINTNISSTSFGKPSNVSNPRYLQFGTRFASNSDGWTSDGWLNKMQHTQQIRTTMKLNRLQGIFGTLSVFVPSVFLLSHTAVASDRLLLCGSPQVREAQIERHGANDQTLHRWHRHFSWASNDKGAPDVVMACCGDVPTLETLAAVDIMRRYLPDLKIRVINVVNLMKLQPVSEHH